MLSRAPAGACVHRALPEGSGGQDTKNLPYSVLHPGGTSEDLKWEGRHNEGIMEEWWGIQTHWSVGPVAEMGKMARVLAVDAGAGVTPSSRWVQQGEKAFCLEPASSLGCPAWPPCICLDLARARPFPAPHLAWQWLVGVVITHT